MKVFIHRMFLPDHIRESEFFVEIDEDLPVDKCLRTIADDSGFQLTKIIDETGAFRPHIAVFIENEQQRPPDGSVVCANVSEISVFPALSGG